VCGIAGVVAGEGANVDTACIHRMCDAIVHRGPDDEGVFVQGAVGLGMRRLSIIDVGGGHQPIHNEDKSVWVVYNGEAYNFPQLRRELQGRGHHFYTHTDTEVIVHLYEEMDANCVTRLRGMFALALYDQRRQSLLLARDRLGKKPLHYALHQGRLLFSSEIKSLLAVAPELAEVDPEGLLQYFYFGYIPDPFTAFRKIRKLPPGHLMQYADGKPAIRQYWDLPQYGSEPLASEEEGLQQLEERLSEAVRIRLISDVPLGALLSGGVDSSIVVALMARASARPVKTFSIGFRHQQFNESRYARLVAERFSTEHHELIVDPDIEDTLAYLATLMEEPFGDSSMVPTYHVCRMARQDVTVALSGDGGDELFAGYDRYLVALQRSKFDQLPDWAGSLYRNYIHPRLPAHVYGRDLAWNASLNPCDRYLDAVSFFPARERARTMFTPEFLERIAALGDARRHFQGYHDNGRARDPLSRLLYLDTKTYLPGDILTKVDRMSMATSLEVRVPMLDHEFVEWVTKLPVEWKFRNGERKYLLKKLAARLDIPRELLDRPKQGFQLPLMDWMKHELKQSLLGVLLEPRTLERGYFRPQAVRNLIEEHLRGRRNRSGMLWRMLVLELWHRNFVDGVQEKSGPIMATSECRVQG